MFIYGIRVIDLPHQFLVAAIDGTAISIKLLTDGFLVQKSIQRGAPVFFGHFIPP
jgi:hypothetical protein